MFLIFPGTNTVAFDDEEDTQQIHHLSHYYYINHYDFQPKLWNVALLVLNKPFKYDAFRSGLKICDEALISQQHQIWTIGMGVKDSDGAFPEYLQVFFLFSKLSRSWT